MDGIVDKELNFEIDSSWDTKESFDVVNISMNDREAWILVTMLLDQLKRNKKSVNVRARGILKEK